MLRTDKRQPAAGDDGDAARRWNAPCTGFPKAQPVGSNGTRGVFPLPGFSCEAPPMKKPIRTRHLLAAAAFSDAMRHILAEEGTFTLADSTDPRRFWTWNGLEWREELLPVAAAALELQPAQAE
jgi:hypothetical protein